MTIILLTGNEIKLAVDRVIAIFTNRVKLQITLSHRVHASIGVKHIANYQPTCSVKTESSCSHTQSQGTCFHRRETHSQLSTYTFSQNRVKL